MGDIWLFVFFFVSFSFLVIRKTRQNAFLFTLWPKQKNKARAVINQSGVRSTSFVREHER